jgi:hypothetical protein
MNPEEPTQSYGYAGEQPGDPYGWQPPEPEPPAFSMRAITIIVICTAVSIIVVGVIGALLVHGRNTQLSHTAVERYIADTYNVDVTCNGGRDMPIATGRTYSCVGGGVVLAVHLTDNHGGYEVGESGSNSSQSS